MEPIKQVRSSTVVIPLTDIDTDQIIPARFLTTTTKQGLGKNLFADWRYSSDGKARSDLVLNNPESHGAQILVAGRNFGCGSSREHAPWALEDYGFRAIVAPSFADIFYSNCTKIGLLPVPLDEREVRAVMDAGRASIDLDAQKVSWAGGEATFEIDPETKRRLLEGLDDIGVTLQQADAIDAYEAGRERVGPVTTSLA